MTDSELDKLSAIHVMGFHYTKAQLESSDLSDRTCWNDTYHAPESWHPTTDISQAWECLEKLDPEQYIFKIWGKSAAGWRCEINRKFYCTQNQVEYAATVPEAIIRACLKAKGVNIE